MKLRYVALFIIGLALTGMLAVVVSAELFGDYVSYQACQACHQETTDAWLKTPHAHAFATLKEQGAEKQEAAGCVKCHVVAMDAEGGFIDLELTPELADVQCEACHGPGKKHVETQNPADIISKPGADACRKCHTKGQDKNFDYEKKSKRVH